MSLAVMISNDGNTADILISVFKTNDVLVRGFLYSITGSVIVMNRSKMECLQYHGTRQCERSADGRDSCRGKQNFG